MKKYLSLVVAALFLGLLVTGCGGSQGEQQKIADQKGQPIVLKLGHIQTQEDLWQLGAERFAQLVAQKTGGQVKIEIYPNSTLGGDRDMAEGMQMGSVDFALIAGVLGNFEKSFQILELPYLFEDEEHLRKVIYGPIGEELLERLRTNANIRGLAFWERGSRQVTSNKPINSIEDIKGLKIRVPEIPAMVEAWKAMGANPTPMAWSEVYSALEQNVIEAQENPIPYIYAGNIHEVQKYLAITNHKYEYVVLCMSELTYNKLTPEQRQAIEEAAAEATEYENQLVKEKTEEYLEVMKAKGMQVTYPDIQPFKEKAQSVHRSYAEHLGLVDLYERIVNAK
ncbi:MAG TPA: C4-dicarboxylate ABC transporter substrate-binding protein [Peptococcaceae bacterium]|nr:MAG: TRAP dicarboxylate transporter, DctP subunit [Moorella sp. 60_41]HBT47613.1 C4-dicarboxylate ABC transporter substrate-binding protein [Peptococcaceae bacterium]